MAVFSQRPGSLDLEAVPGDEFTFTATFVMNLTGYTVTASVYKVSDGTTLATPSLVVTPGSPNSTVTLTLTETQTQAIYDGALPTAGFATAGARWWLRIVSPSGYTQTMLSGGVNMGVP